MCVHRDLENPEVDIQDSWGYMEFSGQGVSPSNFLDNFENKRFGDFINSRVTNQNLGCFPSRFERFRIMRSEFRNS